MRGFSKSYAVPGWRLGYVAGRGHLEGVVEGTVTPNVFIRRTIGTLRLGGGEAILEARPANVNGTELMQLNRIWLKRVDE